ncbi:MAG TPA: M1 family metallopeptidase [Gemmatimonadales bacterium]|nr:M1 family metallopeptidase [Gemmatimonadales bacterium]
MRTSLPGIAALVLCLSAPALAQDTAAITRADTLRGSITPERIWWDVTFYDLHVAVSPADSSIRGWNGIGYRVVAGAREMQVDLMTPLQVDSMVQDGRTLSYRRDGDAFFVTLASPQRQGDRKTLTVYYHGRPRVAKHAPWDGGFVWGADSLGHPWIATACQGVGASIWWPNKDTQADEPDSQRVAITVPDSLVDVSNGRLRGVTLHPDRTTTYEWFVADPINNYDVAVNAASYAHFAELYQGEDGTLTLDYWPLAYNLDAARRQFQQVKPMLKCFEHWFGPYPWYTDGYKLVETPHLGMEHQSAVAYGNHYQNGYLGRDLSRSGVGLRWDFIIVHESAHEWFGNSLTTADVADMWVHEGFANYSENLFTECQQGREAGSAYVIGSRRNIVNDRPIIGRYGINREGSKDMYYKGGNLLHTIRQIVGDDARWRGILRGLTATYRHQIVTSNQVESYISREAGIDLSKVFDQYLRTARVPVLEYRMAGATLRYRWTDVVPGFAMPLKVTLSDSGYALIHPTEAWQKTRLRLRRRADFRVDQNFYVFAQDADSLPGSIGAR